MRLFLAISVVSFGFFGNVPVESLSAGLTGKNAPGSAVIDDTGFGLSPKVTRGGNGEEMSDSVSPTIDIVNCDMPKEMIEVVFEAIRGATSGFNQFGTIADTVRQQMEKKYPANHVNKQWHAIVGSLFGSSVMSEDGYHFFGRVTRGVNILYIGVFRNE